jgi:hypothetical protein
MNGILKDPATVAGSLRMRFRDRASRMKRSSSMVGTLRQGSHEVTMSGMWMARVRRDDL